MLFVSEAKWYFFLVYLLSDSLGREKNPAVGFEQGRERTEIQKKLGDQTENQNDIRNCRINMLTHLVSLWLLGIL